LGEKEKAHQSLQTGLALPAIDTADQDAQARARPALRQN
jgi:hypothetical protein